MANDVEIVVKGKDQTAQAFDSVNRRTQQVERSTEQLGRTMQTVASKAQAAVGGRISSAANEAGRSVDRLRERIEHIPDKHVRVEVDTKQAGGASSALSGITDKVKGLGVAAAATAGIIALDLIKNALGKLKEIAASSIDAASNLNESINAVNVVFKGSAKQIEEWGKTQSNAYGLSQRAFNEMATPLGALLKNQGVAQDKLAETTINLTKRAADLASVFNTSVPDALEALTAGLRGETDPLERYGVSLNAAQVEAEALAETHKKSASQLTDQEKALARLNLIFKQTNDSAGDFRNTSNGLANSSRILAARQEELQAQIGQKLLPVMNKLNQFKLTALEFLGNTVLPMVIGHLRVLAEAFQSIWQKALPTLRKMLDDIQQKWDENRDKIEKLTPLLKALGVFLGVTLVAALTVVYGWVMLFIDGLGLAGDKFAELKGYWELLVVALIRSFGKILDAAAQAFGWIPGIGDKLRKSQAEFHKWADSITNEIEGIPEQKIVDVRIRVSGAEALGNAASAINRLVSQGLAHRASGGIAGGLTEIAERGSEIVKLPNGTMVYSAANTNQQIAQMTNNSAESPGYAMVVLELDGTVLGSGLAKLGRTGKMRLPAKTIVG